MSEKIEPALLSDEWEHGRHAERDEQYRVFGEVVGTFLRGAAFDTTLMRTRTERARAAIAVLNDGLDDADARKITADRLRLLGAALTFYERLAKEHQPDQYTIMHSEAIAELRQFADGLNAYLRWHARADMRGYHTSDG